MKYRYDAVLFDLDETLLLSRPTQLDVLCDALLPSGFARDDVRRAHACGELWIARQVQKENQTGVLMPDDEFLACLTGEYRRVLALTDAQEERIKPLLMGQYPRSRILRPGMTELIAALRGAGLRTGIVSNNSRRALDTVHELGLAELMDCIVISEIEGLYKPDPAILRLACARVGVAEARAVYVGDHPFDVLCARDAGMAALWWDNGVFDGMPEGVPAPDAAVRSVQELRGALAIAE